MHHIYKKLLYKQYKQSGKDYYKYSLREKYKSFVPYLMQSLTSNVHAHTLIMLPVKGSKYIRFGST